MTYGIRNRRPDAMERGACRRALLRAYARAAADVVLVALTARAAAGVVPVALTACAAAGVVLIALTSCAPTPDDPAVPTADTPMGHAANTAAVPTPAVGPAGHGADNVGDVSRGFAYRWALFPIALRGAAHEPGAWSGDLAAGTPGDVAAGTSGGVAAGASGGVAAGASGGAPGAPACPAGIARRDGDRLVVGTQPFTFFGINVQYLLEPSFPEALVEPLLADLAAGGVNTVRVWFLADHDPDRLDRTLAAGNRHGVRFVVTLGDNVHIGRDWFFGDDDAATYRPHLERTVARFRDRPEVLAWEVMNEANCGERFDADCVKTIKDWLVMATGMVKAVDPCHLVSTGVIGAGNYDFEHTAYRRLHRAESVDLVSVHRDADADRSRELDIAAEVERPVMYGEVYARAYDDGCNLLDGGKTRSRRAGQIVDDLRRALDAGVDGYLLWDFTAGLVEQSDGARRDYCSVFGYEVSDPVWAELAEAGLPPAVPWQ